MKVNFGAYSLKIHELDNKLSVQVSSELGEIEMIDNQHRSYDFPNGICFRVKDIDSQIEPKGLKRFSFGEYTFILGINYSGELFLFHSVKLYISKKLIEGKNTLTLAFLTEPKM
jgi:hypothetical protein